MTNIELTKEQGQALQGRQGNPVDVIDPNTQERYVLLAREQYERVRSLLEISPAATAAAMPRVAPLMLKSMQSYWRDLTDLVTLKSTNQQWVAYHGDDRVCFGRTEVDVYQSCFRRGLQRGEFFVGALELDPEGIPPWGTLDGEWSLYRCL